MALSTGHRSTSFDCLARDFTANNPVEDAGGTPAVRSVCQHEGAQTFDFKQSRTGHSRSDDMGGRRGGATGPRKVAEKRTGRGHGPKKAHMPAPCVRYSPVLEGMYVDRQQRIRRGNWRLRVPVFWDRPCLDRMVFYNSANNEMTKRRLERVDF
ncbi:hypothetical protein GWI33_022617 [Rhynchophorus ferrugineus]|uniref:Uncharacterized protein n=1 Tax=Rhynchophorus ferrugineus TaxID=354439 RepID=A0A834HM03_RHYFE|nr:hypothetical protein GWI33_022617 [Rhynchophorus ferrugineus]